MSRPWPSEICPRCGGDCEIETGHMRLCRTTGAVEIETVRCDLCGGSGEVEGELVLAAPYGMAEEDCTCTDEVPGECAGICQSNPDWEGDQA